MNTNSVQTCSPKRFLAAISEYSQEQANNIVIVFKENPFRLFPVFSLIF